MAYALRGVDARAYTTKSARATWRPSFILQTAGATLNGVFGDDMETEILNMTRNEIPSVPQYYRVNAVAERLGLSEKTIIRRMAGDPEVLVMTERKRGTRRYQTYLIPESAIRRLIDSLRPHV